FEKPDTATFPLLGLAYKAISIGGTMPAVLNGANEAAVLLFLEHKIDFLDIPQLIEQTMNGHNTVYDPSLDEILTADLLARNDVNQYRKGW
ncbi:MAG: 1-deoxy-D-xylulose-5-phosphate reductoisomerase, partial [Bacillota bacterium]|nr:1-deoxy-D-xylulose-5-phosphate reductoisomerase [Bacillota bacterium]